MIQRSLTLLFVRRNSAINVFTSSFVLFVVLVQLKNSSGVGSRFTSVDVPEGADVVGDDITRRPDAMDESLCFPAAEGCGCNTELLGCFVGRQKHNRV